MSRKKSKNFQGKARKLDVKYGSEVVEMLVNKIMWAGKKSVSYSICYSAIEKAAEKIGCTPTEALEKALNNVKPLLEVKSRRVGGATYQVPVEVSWRRSTVLGIRWLVGYARARKGMSMSNRLSAEILSAAKGEGAAVKKREDTHKMAEANKAFAHYRW
jgi:small subunit ribosomal protein S7